MHYVKHFDINGVDTKQVACIELHGKPNAATEGCVGVLGIDVDSPTHDVYKCVARNGSIYTWELLSSGMSMITSTIGGEGIESVQFPYVNLRTPAMYVVKIGDLIFDKDGYVYQIVSLNSDYCNAIYSGIHVVAYGKSAYDLAVKNGFEGSEEEWIASLKGEEGKQGPQGEQGVVDYSRLNDYAKLKSPNDMLHNGNEFTFIPAGHTGELYINYRTASGATDGNISNYHFCNGAGGEATIMANYFKGKFQGADARPIYNNAEVAMLSDVPTVPTLKTETWTFALEDGSTVTKAVYVG